MSITLETIAGNTVDGNSLINVQVERTRKPAFTVYYAKNVSSGYVVAEAPENINEFLISNFAKDEQELATVYMSEEEDRVKEHNERGRQKIPDWEKMRETLIREWRERENRRIPDWEERERNRREEYDLERAIRQEDTERASLGYAGLVFDALERRGRQIDPIRTWYRKNGRLSPLRQEWLRKFLFQEGVQDNIIEDIVNLTISKDAVLKEGLRGILVEQLGVVFPEVKPLELLPPYQPEPIPEPEPRPNIGQRPEITMKEVPPLLQELESVVLTAYKGEALESLNLTQQAWDDVGIVPREIYGRIRENVRFLNSQYMFVAVVFGGNKTSPSSINLVIPDDTGKGLKLSEPKGLRGHFIRPTELVEDAYALSLLLWPKINSYLHEHEKDNEVFSNAKTREDVQLLARTIYKAILGRTTPLITNVFPELTESSVSEDKLSKYENLAQRVKSAFEKGLLDAHDIPYEGKNSKVSANELAYTIKYLVDLLPEELFELRYQTTIMNWAERTVRNMPLRDYERRMKLNTIGIQYVESVKVVGSSAEDKTGSLTLELGIMAEGRKNVWKLNAELGLNAATNVLDRYGISYTIERTNNVTGK